MGPSARLAHRVLDVPANADAAAIDAAYGRARRLLDQDAMASYGMFDAASAGRLREEMDAAYEALMREVGAANVSCSPPAKAASPLAPPPAEAIHEAAPQAPEAPASVPPLPAAPGPSTPQPVIAAPPPQARSLRTRLAPPRQEPLTEPCTGAVLRRLREEAHADIEAVCEVTKIGRRYIKALEEEDYALLPAPVYVRGFVGEYARVLGIDGAVAISTYMQGFTAWARAQL